MTAHFLVPTIVGRAADHRQHQKTTNKKSRNKHQCLFRDFCIIMVISIVYHDISVQICGNDEP